MKPTMKRSSFYLALTALTMGLGASAAALAQSTPPEQSPLLPPDPVQAPTSPATLPAPGATELKGPVVAVKTTGITGKVTAIDRANRMVTVRDDKGHIAALKVGANVPNFDSIDMGDSVTVRYTEAVSLAIAKGGINTEAQIGEIRTKVEADATRKANDGMPGMSAMERTTLVANVFQIDRERGVITLRGTDGVPVSIKVPDKQALADINIDDQVVIGFVQAAAVSIEPGAKS